MVRMSGVFIRYVQHGPWMIFLFINLNCLAELHPVFQPFPWHSTANYKSLKLWNCDNYHLKRKYNSFRRVLKRFFSADINLIPVPVLWKYDFPISFSHKIYIFVSFRGWKSSNEKEKKMFSSLLPYFFLNFKDYIEIPSRCVLSNLAKWSFKRLLLRIYLKYPGKVTISYCTLYFHISNSI